MAEKINLIRPWSNFEITQNTRAPLYNGIVPTAQQELLAQAISAITSGSGFRPSEEYRQLFRQSGMVSMFFLLRFIAGYAGAYTRLTPDLHLDMCNFYQFVRKPGVRAAGFVSRRHFKSTIWTYGGDIWDIIHDPDHEEILASNVIDRSYEFNSYVQEFFRNNDFVAWLYPEYIPEEGRIPHWNASETRVPCKKSGKPNIKITAVGASIQGLHAKTFKVDDLIGEHMLDSRNQLGAENEKAANWFDSAVENIPSPRSDSFVFLCGTRYGPNDAYSRLWKRIRHFYGYSQGEPYEINPAGDWAVYYRAVREDHGDGEQPIFPEEIDNAYLDRVQEQNPWQYWTQMMNMSVYSGLSEFIDYQVHDCTLDIDDKTGNMSIAWYDNGINKIVTEDLANMNVYAACDPAASGRKVHTRTSKSAYVVYARNSDDKRFILHLQSGFVNPTKLFDWLFEGFRKFKGYIRTTNLEIQGPFKVLKDIMAQEQRTREEYINLRGVSAKGDKDARIRLHLQPIAEKGLLYCVKSVKSALWAEMSTFPDSFQKDILDAVAIAEAASRKPNRADYDEDDEVEKDRYAVGQHTRSMVTGY